MKKKDTPGGWKVGRQNAHRKFAARMALARHWEKRWKKDPEFMRRMLGVTIAKNKERWLIKRQATLTLAGTMPDRIPSHAIREEIRLGLSRVVNAPTDPKTVHKVLVRLRLWGIAKFDPDALEWVMDRSVTF
jgi:hypothetical protein